MARKSGLSIVANRPEPEAEQATPAASPAEAAAPIPPAAPRQPRQKQPARVPAKEGGSRYAGQFHVGASYDENDDTVEAFRLLAFKKRRSTKDLLHEAMQLLVAKYDPYGKAK